MDQCTCGSPVLPADVVESLSERGKPLFVKLFLQYLEKERAPREEARFCCSCKWPYLVLQEQTSDDLIPDASDACPWCFEYDASGKPGHLDLKFAGVALGAAEWEQLMDMCNVEKLECDWWRLKGSAGMLAESLQQVEQWTTWVSENINIPPHTKEFIIKLLKNIGVCGQRNVRYSVKERRIELEGYSAHVKSTTQHLNEEIQGVCSRQLAVSPGKAKIVIGPRGATVKDMEDNFNVTIWVGTREVFVSGFASGVEDALLRINNLIEDHDVYVSLPAVGSCMELSWKFLKPTLSERSSVVHNSSRPGEVHLRGPQATVLEADNVLRSRLRAFVHAIIHINSEQKGLVIGQKGATVKKLEADGASVCVGKDGDDSVYVGGEKVAVQDAVAVIQRLLQQSNKGKRKGFAKGNGIGCEKGGAKNGAKNGGKKGGTKGGKP